MTFEAFLYFSLILIVSLLIVLMFITFFLFDVFDGDIGNQMFRLVFEMSKTSVHAQIGLSLLALSEKTYCTLNFRDEVLLILCCMVGFS